MSARKIGFLILLLAAGGAIEAAWSLRSALHLGPGGCRAMGDRFYGPSYTFESAEERPVTASPRVEVRNAFGDVRVTPGAPGAVKVRLRKTVFLPAEGEARAFADRIELALSSDGSLARVGTNRDTLRREDVGFQTHLEIEVPTASAVRVRNEHGRVDVGDVAEARIESSFDVVSVAAVARDLEIESRHGDVAVEHIGGALDLTSRHGDVSVQDVRGRVTLAVQQGDLTVSQTGSLEVSQQHGGVEVMAVDGDLLVRASHAGIRATDVRGRADVETSFAGAELLRIGGAVRAKVDHGEVRTQDVAGDLTVESSYEGVRLERVSGSVDIAVHHGGVIGRDVAQGARIRASGEEVVLDGFTGPVDIELERGDATLAPRAPIVAPLTVNVRNGEVTLDLPDDGDIDLEAESQRGEIRSEISATITSHESRTRHGSGERMNARLGNGGTVVRVRADGDIRLTSVSSDAITKHPIAKPDLSSQAAAVAGADVPEDAKPIVEALPGGTTQ